MKNADTITAANWKAAVLAAVAALPDDIRGSVGHSERDGALVIRVCAEPIKRDSNPEGETVEIALRWFEHYADELTYLEEQQRRTMLADGFSVAEVEASVQKCSRRELIAERFPDSLAKPSISVHSPAESCVHSLSPGQCRYAHLKKTLHIAILEALWGGGGASMVVKDGNDRYVRNDGSPILRWQFKPRAEGPR